MTRTLWIGLVPMLLAAPSAAQGVDESRTLATPSFAGPAPMTIERRGFSFPVVEFTEPNGARTRQRGIIASKQVASGALIGIGLFETMPKVRGFTPDLATEGAPKRKRRAAVGLTVKF